MFEPRFRVDVVDGDLSGAFGFVDDGDVVAAMFRGGAARRDEGLFIRRDAAIKLVLLGEITGWDALSVVVVVVAPPPTLATIGVRRKAYRESVRIEARRLYAAGLTAPEVARELGVPFATVKSWLWPPGEAERLRRNERGRQKRARAQEFRTGLAA